MAENKSKVWQIALRFVQFKKNRALDSGRLLTKNLLYYYRYAIFNYKNINKTKL